MNKTKKPVAPASATGFGIGNSRVVAIPDTPQIYLRRPSAADERFLPPSRGGFDRLLSLFELEKLVYELRYEARNRPDWASIPVIGLLRLLGTPG